MKLQPLSNRLLVAPLEEQAVTASGIILPDTVDKTKHIQGEIVAVGPGKMNEKGERTALSVKVGDRVLFKKPWSEDDKMKVENKEMYLVDEDDVLGVIEK
ncbi:co-chaperone GroES [Candidatus Jorgensenbacteria bacterium RIFCSPLOWO2_01_FULL_45_25b]|uniref:Co-chaperonin GroES n=1 Tax=Candidatus Jorgensenbacteria bacterium RIFCSPLOWO2_01_FULL_45_25b TaxID=1798471 RepID=A0A1F6BW23_9BACT|nr:MAG: co-chaperone GroES [Candidatus Jorgensenbacteria bacterium RIFCSPLOWO2_01_FULL_45_25b]